METKMHQYIELNGEKVAELTSDRLPAVWHAAIDRIAAGSGETILIRQIGGKRYDETVSRMVEVDQCVHQSIAAAEQAQASQRARTLSSGRGAPRELRGHRGKSSSP